jgi:hypothetical protein
MLLCCTATLYLCASCRLALENEGTDTQEDRLIGVFVTAEHIDLFDFEGYMNDNLNTASGGEIVMNGETREYQGRLYASPVTRTSTNDETGETSERREYVFENVKGFAYYAPTTSDMIYTASDEAISDSHVNFNYGDYESGKTMKGTIYVVPTGRITYFFNPVYQNSDGDVYLTTGQGMASSGTVAEGTAMSQTIENTGTVTENGVTKTDSVSIEMSVATMFAPEKIVILQMDGNGVLVSRTEYAPDAMPDSLTPESETAFLIVETRKRGAEGSETVTREIYGDDAEGIKTFYAREDGVCVKHHTQVKANE